MPPDLKDTPVAHLEGVPPLESGQHLSREEFERRYNAMPGLKKAELIEGVVRMPSPVRQRCHGRPHLHVATWIGVYESATPGVEGGDNSTTRLDLANTPQPDVLLFIDPNRGGQVHISADDYIEEAPELVIEVAASTVSDDLGPQLEVYHRTGVREYIVWRVLERQVDWFVLRGGQFEQLPPGPDGIIRSEVFPGLWLDHQALVRGDLARVLAVVGQGIASPEHAAFVARLNPPPADP